jgi:hypothetical protein
MLRSAVGKVMWVGRATVFLVGLAVILALVFGVAATALAGTGVGATFNLGRTNTVDAISKLVGSTATSMLMVDNNGTGTALDLRVGQGTDPTIKTVAPMKVDSQARVTNLNADELDGNDSTAFLQSNASAGGDISGNYANLQINQGAVGPSEVADSSLDVQDVAEKRLIFTQDPPSVNGQSCANFTETTTLVDADDLVLMNAPANLPSGLVPFTLRPTSGNPNLHFRLCNVTSNPIDAGLVDWSIAVFDDGNDL